MKKFLVLISMTYFSLSALAFQERDMNINAGAGVFGSRGLIGASLDRFFAPNHALSVALGADFIACSSERKLHF